MLRDNVDGEPLANHHLGFKALKDTKFKTFSKKGVDADK